MAIPEPMIIVPLCRKNHFCRIRPEDRTEPELACSDERLV